MNDFEDVFGTLRQLFVPYLNNLDVKHDDASEICINTRFIQPNKTPLYFGGVHIKKSFVSFHLMPVYVCPELLNNISPALKRRMQGKSCFNFKVVDHELFNELRHLVAAGYDHYRRQGYVP